MTTASTAAAASQAKMYNLVGVISAIALHQDAKDRPFASFVLTSASTGKVQKCLVFAEHLPKVQAAVEAAAGTNVRIFGRFNRRSFTGADGKPASAVRFLTLWAGLPKAKASAVEGQTEDTSEALGF